MLLCFYMVIKDHKSIFGTPLQLSRVHRHKFTCRKSLLGSTFHKIHIGKYTIDSFRLIQKSITRHRKRGMRMRHVFFFGRVVFSWAVFKQLAPSKQLSSVSSIMLSFHIIPAIAFFYQTHNNDYWHWYVNPIYDPSTVQIYPHLIDVDGKM